MNELSETSPEALRDEKMVQIIVNGRPFSVPKGSIAFEQVVALVFPDAGNNPQNIYSVTYKKSGNEQKPEGILVAGATVKVKEGTRFNVSQTGQS